MNLSSSFPGRGRSEMGLKSDGVGALGGAPIGLAVCIRAAHCAVSQTSGNSPEGNLNRLIPSAHSRVTTLDTSCL